MSHVAHMNEIHVTHMNEPCHADELRTFVDPYMSHIHTCHAHMNASSTYINESRRTYE